MDSHPWPAVASEVKYSSTSSNKLLAPFLWKSAGHGRTRGPRAWKLVLMLEGSSVETQSSLMTAEPTMPASGGLRQQATVRPAIRLRALVGSWRYEGGKRDLR